VTHELNESEQTLRRLRDEIDRLTQEIKEANLQSLSIAPADDLKVLLEGTPTRSNSKALCSFVPFKRPLTTTTAPWPATFYTLGESKWTGSVTTVSAAQKLCLLQTKPKRFCPVRCGTS
jgi:hypothetical protein